MNDGGHQKISGPKFSFYRLLPMVLLALEVKHGPQSRRHRPLSLRRTERRLESSPPIKSTSGKTLESFSLGGRAFAPFQSPSRPKNRSPQSRSQALKSKHRPSKDITRQPESLLSNRTNRKHLRHRLEPSVGPNQERGKRKRLFEGRCESMYSLYAASKNVGGGGDAARIWWRW
ncbi:hypothetical protein U1Q18_003740 [Sarracenia purpurea var. burkii]